MYKFYFLYFLSMLPIAFAENETIFPGFTFHGNDSDSMIRDMKCLREGERMTLAQATNGRLDSPCFRCVCKKNRMICTRHQCQPISAHCPLVVSDGRDQCCEKCAECVDERGRPRGHGAVWASFTDKCLRETCQTGVITIARMHCVADCDSPVTLRHTCCPLCPLPRSNRLHADPCVQCEVVSGLYHQCFKIACPVLDCPLTDQLRRAGRCCAECVKKQKVVSRVETACEFRGQLFPQGLAFRPDVCSRCVCMPTGLQCKRHTCEWSDCPNARFHKEVCCPICGKRKPPELERRECFVQVDGLVTKWKESDRWSPEPCTVCDCKRGEVVCQTRFCPEFSCAEDEMRKVPRGKCCPVCEKVKETTVHPRPKPTVKVPPECNLAPNGTLTTFDGDRLQLDSGMCELVLAQRCALDGTASPFVLTLFMDKNGSPKKFGITVNEPQGHQLGKMFINKDNELVYKKRRIKLPRKTNRFYAMSEGKQVLVDLFGTGILVKWESGTTMTIVANKSQNANSVCGLCGNLNGNPADDQWPQFGVGPAASVREFVESWKTDSSCGVEDIYGQADDGESELDVVEDQCSRLAHRSKRRERRRYARNCRKLKRVAWLSTCQAVIPLKDAITQCAIAVCRCEVRQEKRRKRAFYHNSLVGWRLTNWTRHLDTLVDRSSRNLAPQPNLEIVLNERNRAPQIMQQSLRVGPDYSNMETRPASRLHPLEFAVPCYCAPLLDYAKRCASRGLLTFGAVPESWWTKRQARIHPKCPAFKLNE